MRIILTISHYDKKTKNISRIITWLAGIVTGIIIIIFPYGYFLITYHNMSGSLEASAEINARIVAQIIKADPKSWETQQHKLMEYLSRRPTKGYAETRRIVNTKNEIIAESADRLKPPLIMRSFDLVNSGVVMGRIQIFRSLRPILIQTGLVGLLILPIALGAFFVLRILPIRSVYRAEEALQRSNAELEIANEHLKNEIVERKRTEEALHESENKLRTILYSMQVGTVVVDEETHTIVDINNKAVEMIGDPKDKIIGSKCHLYICPAEQGRCPVSDLKQKVDNSERVLLKGNGEKVPIIKTVVPVELGGRGHLIESFLDITERKQMEDERLKKHNLESIGTLAGGIAHDFNNLLMAVTGYIALAREFGSIDEHTAHLLNEAERISLDGKELTQKLITFSKGGTPMKKVMSLSRTIKDSSSMALVGSNIRCEYILSDDLFLVNADKTQIGQVIRSIVLNAKEAMPQGGVITIRASNVTFTPMDATAFPNRNYVKISVEDQGVGIREEDLPKIFDPYFTTKGMGPERGMGLGLAVVYSIIKGHNGNVTVESVFNQGTSVHIYLPAYIKITEDAEAEKKEQAKGKILFMDDEDYMRDIGARFVTHLGYEAVLARDGGEAINLYRQAFDSDTPFDAVILDLTVKGAMGGKEALQELLSINHNVIAIISSGYTDDPAVSAYADYGFRGAVTKPYKITDLEKVLERALSGKW